MVRPLRIPRGFGMVNINFYDLVYVEIVLPNSVLALGCDGYWSSTSDRRDWASSSNVDKDGGLQAGTVRAYGRVPIVEAKLRS